MTAAKVPPLHILRAILRHTKPAHRANPSVANNAPSSEVSGALNSQASNGILSVTGGDVSLREHIMAQYRASQNASPEMAEFLRKMAYDFHIVNKDLVERGRLHELDGGAEVKLSPMEMSRRAAARAGLQLPETHSE